MRTAALVFVTVLGVASTAHAQSSQSPSLGDIAKAEAARRAALTGKSPVFTNADLKPAPSPIQPPGVVPSAAVQAAPMSLDAEQRVKDEAYWKDRMRPLQAALDADMTARDATATRLADYTAEMDRTYRYRNGFAVVDRLLRQKVLDTQDELSRATAAVKTDRIAIAALEEEARVAGVPLGWLRPGPAR